MIASMAEKSSKGVLASIVGVFGAAFFWLISFKAVAYWLGPEGVGLFSQLRQITQAATIGATFGGTNPVVQGLAERDTEPSRLQFRAAAARLVGVAGICMVLFMAIAAPQLASFFLSSDAAELVTTVRWIALAVMLNVGGTYALGVLNGYRSFSYLALAQVAGPAVLALLLGGAWWGHVQASPQLLGIGFALCFGVTCLVAALGLRRLPKAPVSISGGTLPMIEKGVLLRFAASNLVAALSTTLTLLLIRSWIIGSKGLAFAGLFDAGWTLTFNYTTLFLTACSTIYLPLLTAAVRPQQQKACVLKTAYLVFAVGSVICYGIVLFKEPLINLLYSPQFQPSGQVLMVLVVAVMLRGVSWVYGTVILATRNSRVLLISDLALNLLLLIAARISLTSFGSLEALGWAFVLPNFFYLVFVVEYVKRKNPLVRRRSIWPYLTGGVVPLIYLALVSEEAYSALAVGLCVSTGLLVGAASYRAYRKVNL